MLQAWDAFLVFELECFFKLRRLLGFVVLKCTLRTHACLFLVQTHELVLDHVGQLGQTFALIRAKLLALVRRFALRLGPTHFKLVLGAV